MTNKVLAYVAIIAVPVASLAGAIGAAYYGGAAKAAPAAPVATAGTPPPQDLVAQLAPRPGVNAGTSLYGPAGDWRKILDLTLPRGRWVLQASETIVNVGPPDYTRCIIAADPATPLDQQSTYVGDSGQAATAAALSETAALTLTARASVSLYCDHRLPPAGPNLPYIDPGAVLWAHQAGSLSSTTESLP